MAKKKKSLSLFEKIQKVRQAGLANASGVDARRNAGEKLEDLDLRVRRILGLYNELDKQAGNMIYFVMYDIEHNRVRHHIAKFLERKGLIRIQKSIFLGSSERKQFTEIHQALRDIQALYDNSDSIVLVPVSTDELKAMKVIGQNIDLDMVLGRRNTLFI